MDTSSSGRIKQRAIVTGGAFDCLISIPCFRESKRLPFFLDALCKELACAPFKASIVIVDAFIGRTYDRTVHREVFSKMDIAKGRSTYESESFFLAESHTIPINIHRRAPSWPRNEQLFDTSSPSPNL